MESLRALPKPKAKAPKSATSKGKGKASDTASQAAKSTVEVLTETDEWRPLEFPLSAEAKARMKKIEFSKLDAVDLVAMVDTYTMLTIAVIDWLHQASKVIELPTSDDPAANQEAQIKLFANKIAEKT